MFDFCGIGNACIDIVSKIDDDFLHRWQYPKSICTYLTLGEADALQAALPAPVFIPGGCGANTAACVTALGGRSAFLGRVADDAIGKIFLDDMKAWNIRYTGIPDSSAGAGSTRIFALITPDTERTFASYYGVQESLSQQDLDEDSIRQSQFMYLDGYALNSKHGGEAFLKAAEISKAAGNQTVFSPSDISILTKYQPTVQKLIAVSDIILCNKQEAMFQTGAATLSEALQALQKLFACGAVTVGEEGVYVFDHTEIRHVEAARPPSPVTDTNGAGDHFAGGFLYGLSQGFAIDRAARLGNLCAAAIITHAGARPRLDYKPFVALSA